MAVTNVVHAFEAYLEGSRFSRRLFFNMVSLLLCIQKLRGTFQHSRFLAGGATFAAGKLTVQNGVLKVICQTLKRFNIL